MVYYDKYIKGAYYHKLESISPAEQKILNALREKYPNGLSVLELANVEPDIRPKTAYSLCKKLAKDHFIIAKKEKVAMKRSENYPSERFYFEDYNYFRNKEVGFSHPFAPGYVQYDESFLGDYEKVKDNGLESKVYELLEPFLLNTIRTLKRTHSRQQCKFCGYDHEMRDFMRATLLHLIDELESNIEFISFMNREGIINEATYERLKAELRRTPNVNEQKETAQKELIKEQQSTQWKTKNKQRDMRLLINSTKRNVIIQKNGSHRIVCV